MTIASTPTTTKRTVIATALAGVAALSVGAARLFADREGPDTRDVAAAARTPRATPLPVQAEVDLLIRERAGAPAGTTPEFFFEPTGIAVRRGARVRFKASTPHHTATAYHAQHVKSQRVPEGVPPFSSPVIPVGETWTYIFTRPGVYDLWCGPHEFLGMAMRIVVEEATGPGAAPPTDFSPSGTTLTAGLVLSDPALAPARILARGRVSWDELDPASKRLPDFLR